jgi:hypothetical protein
MIYLPFAILFDMIRENTPQKTTKMLLENSSSTPAKATSQVFYDNKPNPYTNPNSVDGRRFEPTTLPDGTITRERRSNITYADLPGYMGGKQESVTRRGFFGAIQTAMSWVKSKFGDKQKIENLTDQQKICALENFFSSAQMEIDSQVEIKKMLFNDLAKLRMMYDGLLDNLDPDVATGFSDEQDITLRFLFKHNTMTEAQRNTVLKVLGVENCIALNHPPHSTTKTDSVYSKEGPIIDSNTISR